MHYWLLSQSQQKSLSISGLETNYSTTINIQQKLDGSACPVFVRQYSYPCWVSLLLSFLFNGKREKYQNNYYWIIVFILSINGVPQVQAQTTDSVFFQSCQQNPVNSFCFVPNSEFDIKTCLPAQSTTQLATIKVPIDTFKNWEIATEIYLGINPSSSNYLEINLTFSSDSSTELCKIRIGDKFDNLTLYNSKNEVLGFSSSLFNRSSSQFEIRLLFQSSKLNIVWHWKDSIEWNLLATASLHPQSTLTTLSVNLIQTGSSSVGKWSFNQLIQKPITNDLTGPEALNISWKSSNSAWIEFNESIRIDATRCLISDSANIGICKKINHNTLEITSLKPWKCNDSFWIYILNIADSSKNTTKICSIRTIYPCILPIKRGQIIVTEIMHNPPKYGQNPVGIPPIKYLEIQNTHSQGLWLTNAQLCDAVSCTKLPNYWLKPEEILVLYSAKDSNLVPRDFKKISYPVVNFPSFNTTDDSIIIKNQKSEIIYQNRYREEYHKEPYHLGGYSLERAFLNPTITPWLNWQSNNQIGGTPGYIDSCIRIPTLPKNIFSAAVFNENKEIEIQCIQPLIKQQWETVEFYAQDSLEQNIKIDVSLQASNSTYARFLLKTPSIRDVMFNNQLLISAKLFSEIIPFVDTVFLINQSEIKKPTTQDVIISEIQFSTTENGIDFLEIYNKSNTPLDLRSLAIRYYYNDSIPRWQIPISEINRILLPKQCLIICKDAEIMHLNYPDLPMNRVMENSIFIGLNADFGLLELFDIQTFTRLHLAGYNARWHHPEIDQTQNISLERVGVAAAATNPWNWRSHGKYQTQNRLSNPCYKDSSNSKEEGLKFCSPGFHKEWTILENSSTFKLNQWKFQQSSNQNYLCLEYQLPMPDCLIQVKMLTVSGHLIATPIQKERIDFSGNLCFPANSTAKLPKGAYLISVRCLLPDGNTIQKQLPFTIL